MKVRVFMRFLGAGDGASLTALGLGSGLLLALGKGGESIMLMNLLL